MFATTKTVTINEKEILCKDLKYGYLLGLENKSIVETKHGVIMAGTKLSEEEILDMCGSEVDELYMTISRLTYPHAYNEDGSAKEFEEEDSDKKKA